MEGSSEGIAVVKPRAYLLASYSVGFLHLTVWERARENLKETTKSSAKLMDTRSTHKT
jgi:hypothetical protein